MHLRAARAGDAGPAPQCHAVLRAGQSPGFLAEVELTPLPPTSGESLGGLSPSHVCVTGVQSLLSHGWGWVLVGAGILDVLLWC